jgi:hypothetical protein
VPDPHRRFPVLALALALLSWGCASGPSDVVLRAASAVANGDHEAFEQALTARSAALVGGFRFLAVRYPGVFGPRPGPKPELVEEKAAGDRATVRLREATAETEIPLRFEDGAWRIDLLAMEPAHVVEMP